MRYLKGTPKLSIRYRKLDETHPHYEYNELGLHGAVDATYASDLSTAKSVTGYVFFLAGAPVLWSSKLQNVVARSSAESE